MKAVNETTPVAETTVETTPVAETAVETTPTIDLDSITVETVVAKFSTVNEAGEVTSFDIDGFEAFIKQLNEVKKEVKEKNKEALKEAKKAERAVLAVDGESYYKALPIGAKFTYKDAKGNLIEAIKIETKSKTGATAACKLLNPPANAKTTLRYPKFYQVVLPEVVEESTEEATEAVA